MRKRLTISLIRSRGWKVRMNSPGLTAGLYWEFSASNTLCERKRKQTGRKCEKVRNRKKRGKKKERERRLISMGSLTEFPLKQKGKEMHALKLDSGL